MNETFNYELDGLEAFTNYTVTVVACTSFCSNLNENLKITTTIGEPGVMFQPRMESLEDNSVLISWDVPKVIGGNLEFFQFRASKHDGNARIYRINGKARSCVIKSLNCDSEKIDFSIRSVNVGPTTAETMETTVEGCFEFREPIEGEVSGHFYGEWSEPVVFYCQFRLASMMASVFILLIFLVVFSYLMVRMYQKIKDMKDIHIVWPKGLDPESPVKSDICEAVKDLDLIKNHVLTDIEEEEEIEKFIEKPESVKSELFLPFICNPKTNEVFYTMPTIPTERVNMTPKSNQTMQLNSPTDYMKMYAPAGSSPVSPVAGYLDMSGGRSPVTPKKSPSTDYHDNDVKMFIKDKEMHNNGYIGKRASIICEAKKTPVVVNANGYVGLQK